ncbi:MAG: enoyl-CoA hydratase/isomerase family protein [Candidatus Eisenbacteria bacterium]|nr:enoyl-CoA hydratase/isomerase family protein [Candidatus Eisenbacteria bacterium]
MSGAFRIEWPRPGLPHLVMDDPARRVNVIDEAAIGSLEAALDELERAASREGDAPLEGVVVVSGKSGSFIAGADVNAIASMTDRAEVLALIRRAHAAFGRLAALAAPTVAAINGPCLGGGTELALACDSRIASDEPRTQIGLPETLLGIFPGFGGTTRLPRLIGARAALDLILTGRALDAKRAERAGLIARAVPGTWLIEAAYRRLEELGRRPAGQRRDAYRARDAASWALECNPFGRRLVFQQARAMTRARTHDRYPAPLAAIRVMELGWGRPIAEALRHEAEWVSDLVVGPVCKNLVRIFLLSERAKKDDVAAPGVRPAEVRSLALVGSGVMGGGIAELASRNGIAVRMRDVQPASLTRALETVRGIIAERGRKRRSGAGEPDNQMARILPTLELTGFKRADAAIEAVVEDLDVKRRVFGELEVRMRDDALLATNTSSLSVNALADGLEHPERFCGFHFFNPVHRMPLVEVVRGAKTSDATLATAVALARRLGKTPVVVNDAPGFVVNRILMPYLREAMHLLEEGYALTDIDASMRRFGMPMGPFEVVDEVGIDVASKVAGVLSKAFPDRMSAAPALDKLLAAKRLGKKSALGFYRHRGKKHLPDPALGALLGLDRERKAQSPDSLAERMVLGMINESARCLEDDVVSDAGMLDLAMIFGAGFPPFRGGPLRHADTLGLARVEERLTALRAECGERFAPARMLASLAARGGTFTSPVA